MLGCARAIHYLDDLYDSYFVEDSDIYNSRGEVFRERDSLKTSKEIYQDLCDYVVNNELTYRLSFVTIQPSKEFMYQKFNGFMTCRQQLAYLRNAIRELKLNCLSISIETGSKKVNFRTYYHYHVIFEELEGKKTKKKLNALRDYYTTLHLVNADGFQSAVKESETNSSINRAIGYWSGFKRVDPDIVRKEDHLFCIVQV